MFVCGDEVIDISTCQYSDMSHLSI